MLAGGRGHLASGIPSLHDTLSSRVHRRADMTEVFTLECGVGLRAHDSGSALSGRPDDRELISAENLGDAASADGAGRAVHASPAMPPAIESSQHGLGGGRLLIGSEAAGSPV